MFILSFNFCCKEKPQNNHTFQFAKIAQRKKGVLPPLPPPGALAAPGPRPSVFQEWTTFTHVFSLSGIFFFLNQMVQGCCFFSYSATLIFGLFSGVFFFVVVNFFCLQNTLRKLSPFFCQCLKFAVIKMTLNICWVNWVAVSVFPSHLALLTSSQKTSHKHNKDLSRLR